MTLAGKEEWDLNVAGREEYSKQKKCEQRHMKRKKHSCCPGKQESLEFLWRMRCLKERGGTRGWSQSGKCWTRGSECLSTGDMEPRPG